MTLGLNAYLAKIPEIAERGQNIDQKKLILK